MRIIKNIVVIIAYYLAHLFPRKKNRWVFGEAYGFNSNSKYLFLEVIHHYPQIEAYWIGEKKIAQKLQSLGLPAYYRYSIKGLRMALTSSVYVVSFTQGDISSLTFGGASIINLWHGVGWKACVWNESKHRAILNQGFFRRIIHAINYPLYHFRPNVVLSSSSYMTKYFFASMFDVKESSCVESIYPRCKFMLQKKQIILDHITKYESSLYTDYIKKIAKYSKVILYAPTFRDANYDFLGMSNIDFEDFNTFLEQNKCLCLFKLHPRTKYNSQQYAHLSNMEFIDSDFDLYLIMPFTDILISDYSSIVFDYMLLKKPIILYPFDKKVYTENCRDFTIKYEESMADFKEVYDYCDLKREIVTNLQCPKIGYSVNKWWTSNYNLMEQLIRRVYKTPIKS